ncbi:hypothetical protein KSW81_000383 [Nannochloris sp. 'desiccata']|nr:hypothetical protein KSW81_000383 [Chlorella desiccata (nom. nud.)]
MHVYHSFRCRANGRARHTVPNTSSNFITPLSPTGRELKGFKVTIRNDPTSPIFRSSTSGGISIAGKGIDIANARTITPVKNVDKDTGEVETTYIKAEGSALAVGKLADADVSIVTEEFEENGDLITTVDTSATGFLGKPKLSAVDASIEQKEVAAGFFAGPDVTVVAESRADVEASQVEKKANSGVEISARTNADVDTEELTASAQQGTTVGDFATGINNPIPNSVQNQETFGQVTAIDENGNIVFQDETTEPQEQP